jgi:serine/threonine-protein kinase
MPAVIGVVFVFLVGVIVWVVASSGGDDEATVPSDPSTTSVAAGETTVVGATTLTTTPAPMPDLTNVTSTTVAPAAPSTVPVTTAPGAVDGAVPGDLAIPGRPMQQPPCDGGYITILASAVGDQATAVGIGQVLETYPRSEYLRTDQTCPSLRASVDGAPIYVVYLGPFAVDTDACAARAEGPEGAYARILSTDLGPDHGVPCA